MVPTPGPGKQFWNYRHFPMDIHIALVFMTVYELFSFEIMLICWMFIALKSFSNEKVNVQKIFMNQFHVDICPFDLYPVNWFEGYPVKSTLWNLPRFFLSGSLKKVRCHTYKSVKKSGYILQGTLQVKFTWHIKNFK